MTPRQLNAAYYLEVSALLVGALLGLLLAWYLHGLGLGNAGEIAAAQEAGIVSQTILRGYPKSRDTYHYLLALLLPVGCALVSWWASRIRTPLGSALLAGGFIRHAFSHRIFWPTVALIAFWSWHSTAILVPAWNPYTGAWPFLGEQGATLAWLQSLADGGVFGRDFFSLYGPMFVYPLSWLMDLTGNHSALVERYHKFLLDLLAFALLTFLLLRTLRSRLLALGLALGISLAFPALMFVNANMNTLRTALALFALVSLALWMAERLQRWRWIGGLVLGQSFLFSQEAAICALAAASVVLYLDALQRGGRHWYALRETALLWGITLLSMAPMLLYLLSHGAGMALLDSLIGYPKMVILGFGALEFPSLRDWLQGGLRAHWIHYAVIAIYAGSAIAVALAWFKGVRSPRLLWAIGLTLFGIMLFRQALGRSGNEQTIKVMLPAVLLTALWLDEAWLHLRNARVSRPAGWVAAFLGVLLLFNFVVGMAADPMVQNRLLFGWRAGTVLNGKFRTDPSWSVQSVQARIGFALDPQTALSVNEISSFLQNYTAPKEPVYFFPNEAAYYHLFERPMPTRYAISYFAATFERQREVIHDLETRRPRFVVYSKRTWRVDDIPESMQLPLIVDYLKTHYRLVRSMNTVDILARN